MSKRSFHLVVLPGLALTAGSLQNRIEGSDARAKCFFMSDVLGSSWSAAGSQYHGGFSQTVTGLETRERAFDRVVDKFCWRCKWITLMGQERHMFGDKSKFGNGVVRCHHSETPEALANIVGK